MMMETLNNNNSLESRIEPFNDVGLAKAMLRILYDVIHAKDNIEFCHSKGRYIYTGDMAYLRMYNQLELYIRENENKRDS